MSDISNSSCSSSNKRRLSKIDDDIEYLTQVANNLNDFVFKTQFEFSLMAVKMKREKVKALSAFARSQVLLTDMEIMIAEGDLYTDIEKLRNFKKIKLEREEGQSQKDSQERNSKSVQTTKRKSDKKKRQHSSSRQSSVDTEETVLIPTIHETTASFEETSQTSKTLFQSLDLFGNSPTNQSDSEVSLSNSIKAAFNEPYTNTQTQEPIKKSPSKKTKTDKKVESKTKSKLAVKQNESPTIRPKTVAELRKSVNTPSNLQNSHMVSAANSSRTVGKTTMASSTYVPIRHNMPAVLTQPSASNRTPLLYINPDQYHSQKAGPSHNFDVYGRKQ